MQPSDSVYLQHVVEMPGVDRNALLEPASTAGRVAVAGTMGSSNVSIAADFRCREQGARRLFDFGSDGRLPS